MSDKPILAIVVPCFNERDVIDICCGELSSVLKSLVEAGKIDHKSYICFVDDGSSDGTWGRITELAESQAVKGIKLSKNFGHQSALLAGLTTGEADIFVTIDADLQDDVNAIFDMTDKYLEGSQIVFGVRNDRNSDSFLKRVIAELYYKFSRFIGVNGIHNHADFRLLSKKVVNILKNSKESNIYLRGIIPNLGFKSDCVYYSRQKRVAGEAKYNFFSLSALAFEGITSFSVVPLRLVTFFGVFCFIIAVLISFYAIITYFTHKIVPGWASTFVSLYFLGGIQLLSLGIIGEYIGKIYKETKQRPVFLVETTTDE